jgi:hypothetical protein
MHSHAFASSSIYAPWPGRSFSTPKLLHQYSNAKHPAGMDAQHQCKRTADDPVLRHSWSLSNPFIALQRTCQHRNVNNPPAEWNCGGAAYNSTAAMMPGSELNCCIVSPDCVRAGCCVAGSGINSMTATCWRICQCDVQMIGESVISTIHHQQQDVPGCLRCRCVSQC